MSSVVQPSLKQILAMDAVDDMTTVVAVLGLGHVGLPTALGFAEAGWHVLGADDEVGKIAQLRRGIAPFFEPGLDELLERHLRSGRFVPVENPADAIRRADVVFVCVGTPQREDGSADLSQVEAVARSVARHLNGYKLVVEKSTTPVRTAERIKQTLLRYRNGNHEVDVAVNPEFLQEGKAIHDVLHPDRIVLGVDSERARRLLEKLYRPILNRIPGPGGCEQCERQASQRHADGRVLVTDLSTAELIKHAANAFLATKISYINMVGDLCEATGADVTHVAYGIGLDPRIGPHFLRAGVGYGGYCLPKDVRAFIRIAEEQGVEFSLLKAVEAINERRVERLAEKVRQALWVVRGKTITVLGLAFKPGTDDIREAPSLKVLAQLLSEGAMLRLHDPRAAENVRRIFPEEAGHIVYCATPYDAASGAHALLLLTEWEEYSALDLVRLRSAMEVPIIIDGRNVFDPAAVRALGFEYYGMGR